MSPSTTITTLLLLSLILTTTATTPIIGLDSFLTQQSQTDPQARKDTFSTLSPSIKISLPLHSLSSLSLSLPPIPISLSIHLIGEFPPNTPNLLSSFLSPPSPSPFHVITTADSFSHHLSLSHTLHLHVTHQPSLSAPIFKAISEFLQTTASPLRTSLLPISFSPIDPAVNKHFHNSNSNPEDFNLYLINKRKETRRLVIIPCGDDYMTLVKLSTCNSISGQQFIPEVSNCL